MSKVAVFGAGYVGLVTGACFAELGHDVAIRDVDEAKIDVLRDGRVPIYEPGLDELIERNRERLLFTLDVRDAIDGAEFVYVAVGTPPTARRWRSSIAVSTRPSSRPTSRPPR